MSTSTNTVFKALNKLFENNNLFEFANFADKAITVQNLSQHAQQRSSQQPLNTASNQASNHIIGYLTPAHPFLIQVVEHNEAEFIKHLTIDQLNSLFKQLIQNNTTHIILIGNTDIPKVFLKQKHINIIRFNNTSSPYQYLLKHTKNIPIKQTSIHGSISVIFNQGILITGDSGTGKSSLLLSLIERGHLWVADDAPIIYLSQDDSIYGTSDEAIACGTEVQKEPSISAFIHVKNMGAINVDQTYGKSKRIPRHRLAAIIHLSNNVRENYENLSGYKMMEIFDQALPKWTLPSNHINLVTFAECIAKQLILKSWGDNTADTLISTHNTSIRSTQYLEDNPTNKKET